MSMCIKCGIAFINRPECPAPENQLCLWCERDGLKELNATLCAAIKRLEITHVELMKTNGILMQFVPCGDCDPCLVGKPAQCAMIPLDEFVKQKEKQVSDLQQQLESAFKGVLSIRCTKHYTVPQQNKNEHGGGQCGGCIAGERDKFARIADREIQLRVQLANMLFECQEALKVAINTVECASIDTRTGEELPWYKMAKKALLPRKLTEAEEKLCADSFHKSKIAQLERHVRNLEIALAESVKLQSFYGQLLNTYDGGSRLKFDDSQGWIMRLQQTGTLP